MTHSARCQSSCYSRGSISVGERRVLSAHPAKMSTDTSIAHREGFPIGWEGYDCPLCITKRLHRHDSHHPDTGTVAGSVSVVCQNLLRQAQHARLIDANQSSETLWAAPGPLCLNPPSSEPIVLPTYLSWAIFSTATHLSLSSVVEARNCHCLSLPVSGS